MAVWKTLQKFVCEFILLFGIILLFTTRDCKIAWDKMITADGSGYYVYLPATFIYHDLSFEFFNQVQPKYYAPSSNPPTWNFINKFDGIRVNKYFPGVAVLCIPFFFAAHVLAHISGMPADGYSPIYQYAIGLAALFYCWLGLYFLKKTLQRFKFSTVTIFWTILALFIGTNLLYQTVYYSSASHVFLFFLITSASYYLILVFEANENAQPALLKAMLLMALIAITRPQDLLLLILLPFLGATLPKIQGLIKQNITQLKFWITFLVCVIIVGIAPMLWYVQTGRLFLNPYTGEHYNFSNPHFVDALFSFRKGWLLYTPLVGLSLFGLFKMPNKLKAINVLLFLLVVVFINSCWWSWTFGPTSYSQRPMVDYYFVPAVLLAFLIDKTSNNKTGIVIKILVVILCGISLLQTYQFRNGIMPCDYNSKENYFKNFFQTKSIAIYPIPKNIVTNYSAHTFDFDKADSPKPVTNEEHYSGSSAIYCTAESPYSAGAQLPIPLYMKNDGVSKVRARAMVKSLLQQGKCTLVLDFVRGGKSVSWNGFEVQPYIHNTNWTRMEFGLILPDTVQAATDSLKFYFWDDKGGKTFIDDVSIEFITTDPTYELHP